MAESNGQSIPPVVEALRENARKFHFFEAVRRLEAAHPDKPRIGNALHIVDESVRFSQYAHLRFAPSAIEQLQLSKRGGRPELLVNFFGMFGPNGPLPHHLTEYAFDRIQNHKDPTFSRFMDVFHHRLLSLFYRAWMLCNQAASHDRPEEDAFIRYFGSLVGIGLPGLTNRDAVPDYAKIYYSGWMARPARSAVGLERVLEDFFRVPVKIQEFIGTWVLLPPDSQCQLGASPDTGTLGLTSVIGSRVWNTQQKFRIAIGPVGRADFERFTPGSPSFQRLVDWVRNYVGLTLDWDVELTIRDVDVPQARLGSYGQLGWTSWLKAPKHGENQLTLRINPKAVFQSQEAACA